MEEQHKKNTNIVRDIIIGMSDGLKFCKTRWRRLKNIFKTQDGRLKGFGILRN
jgi:hypothetical protein